MSKSKTGWYQMWVYSFIFCISLCLPQLSMAKSSHSYSASTKQPAYPVLILDVQADPNLPQNFHTTKNAYPKSAENPPTRQGLDDLNASGSGQFTGGNLKKMLKDSNIKNVYVVDLRKEFHGFLDNIPVSWYGFNNLENKDSVASTVATSEKRLLYTLGTQRKATVYQKKSENGREYFTPRNITFKEVRTEDELVNGSTDYQYLRLYVLDHNPPDNSQIDGFVKFVKSMQTPAWLHVHCDAGEGRTTTFLAMYDMIRNANHVSLDDILKRQNLIGGTDLMVTQGVEEWKLPLMKQRYELLQNFYEYVKDPEGYEKRSFSDWQRYKAKAKKSRFSIFGL